MQTDITTTGHPALRFRPMTVEINAVLRIASLLSNGLVHIVDGVILGIAVALTAQCFALAARSTTLILAAVLIAKSRREFAS